MMMSEIQTRLESSILKEGSASNHYSSILLFSVWKLESFDLKIFYVLENNLWWTLTASPTPSSHRIHRSIFYFWKCQSWVLIPRLELQATWIPSQFWCLRLFFLLFYLITEQILDSIISTLRNEENLLVMYVLFHHLCFNLPYTTIIFSKVG